MIARNTAFTFPTTTEKRSTFQTIRRGGRHPLSSSRGSVRHEAACASAIQLIDAESGNHLWAERCDKPLADLFDMQDEIVARWRARSNANSSQPVATRRN